MQNTVDQLFTQLDNWRYLPAYALERRVDIYFSLYLKEIFQNKYHKHLDVIIQEFPLRIGSIEENALGTNLSKKIDFVGIDQTAREVFLIELKTDMRSRRVKQDEYLLKAQKINVPGLVDGIIQIYKATKQKTKYNYLIKVLESLEWLKKDGKTFQNASHVYRISIIYIQPTNEGNEANTICFDDIISLLHAKEDAFSKRFAKSLELWKMNPNNKKL